MKKISVNTVKSFLKEHKREGSFTKTIQLGESTVEFEVYTYLSVAEKSVFIQRVMDACFDKQGNYFPEYFMPMFRATVLQMLTNLPAVTLKGEQSEDGKALMDLDAMNDLYIALDLDFADNAAFHSLLVEMTNLCNVAINSRIGKSSSLGEITDAICRFIDALQNKVEAIDTDEMMRYAERVSEITSGTDYDGFVNQAILRVLNKDEAPSLDSTENETATE